MAGTATSPNIILKESAQERRWSVQGRRRARVSESQRESPAARWPSTTSRRKKVQRHAGRRQRVDERKSSGTLAVDVEVDEDKCSGTLAVDVEVDEDKSSGTLAVDNKSTRVSPADAGHRR